jgi:phosphomannomutase
MVNEARERFSPFGLTFSIGGQVSFDVFPCGWDKTYALQFLSNYESLYFFGDRTAKGGNDYEIAHSPLVKSFTVTDPADTVAQVSTLFGL